MRVEIPPMHLCIKNRDYLNTERGVVTDATQVIRLPGRGIHKGLLEESFSVTRLKVLPGTYCL